MAGHDPSPEAHPHTVLPETVKHYLETIFYIEHEGERVRPGGSPSGWGSRPPR